MLIKLNPKMESYPFVKLENNGSVLQIFACRVCLATETKLFDLHKHKLVDVFGELTGTQVSRTDGLPQYICSICCTLLRKSSAFRTKCRKVHVLLQDVRVRQPLITTDYIKSIDRSNLKLKFATTNTLTLDLVPKFVEEFIISEQTESSTELNPLVKAEPLTPNPEVTTDSNDCHNDTRKDDTNYEFIAIDTKIKEEVIVIEDKTKKAKPKKVSQKSTVRRTVKREKKRKRPCNMKFLDDFDEFAETYNCKVVFLTKEQQLKEVEERKETESYKRSRFKCTICYKGFMNVSAHQNHMATHDKSSGDHVCEICHSRFNARKTLLNHHHRCHKFSFICNICNYVNKKSYTAKSHYKWHEGFKYECKECNKQYNTRSTYMNHNREYHHSVTCELCKETVNGSKGLEEHNQQRHPIEKFPCKTCFQKFDSQKALDTHLSADGLCNSVISCVKCGENFASKPLLHDHREAAHNETLFRCDKMASKRKKPSSDCPNLFDDGYDDQSCHDPYSDLDGELGADQNYEPENPNDDDTSGSEFEIFSTSDSDGSGERDSDSAETERSDSNISVIENSDDELDMNVTHQLHSRSPVFHFRPQYTSPVIELSTVVTSDLEKFVASNSDILSTQTSPVYQVELTLNADQIQQNAPPQQENQQTVSSLAQPTSVPDDAEWTETIADIPDFNFDENLPGPRVPIGESTTEKDIFDVMFTPEIVEYLVTCTNTYGNSLVNQNRPHTRNSRNRVFHETNVEEMTKFLGLSLLSGQINIPEKRKLFTRSDPLYYHPIFSYVMSSRRYEQILRCLSASELNAKGAYKVNGFIDMLTKNFRHVYYPDKELSLDESMLLFRGRLVFRKYMKNKMTKYGIKFYVLTSHDGYVLNIRMYCGNQDVSETPGGKTIEHLVLCLMKPYLLKGHELYIDNFYNSVQLTEKLLNLRTHTCGTLRENRKGNPTFLVKKTLKKDEYVWLRKNKVYVSNWKDKRQVLMLTSLVQPEMIEVTNRHGQKRKKPKEVCQYNKFISGIERCDQMVNYYSAPRKTIRWYKKVIFHMLDVATWNAFFLFKKYVKKNRLKYAFIEYREALIRSLLQLGEGVSGKDLALKDSWKKHPVSAPVPGPAQGLGHWPVRMPAKENTKKKYSFLNCRVCLNRNPSKRRESSYRCKGCPNSPALCPECFQEWHITLMS